MPRLFTGVEIPTDVSFDLEIMKGGIIGARWIDRESFHITLRFIGDIDGSLAREIAYELGFEHPQSFSKLFRTKTSLSPLEFRQSFN